MSKTPRTDEATWQVVNDDGSTDRWVKVDQCAAIERDLNDCLATLESVLVYLQCGQCLCEYKPSPVTHCDRCRMLADVETTLKNCKP